MQHLDRYIAQSISTAILLVLLVLAGLFLFFTFIEEVQDIGKGDYDTWLAAQYTLLIAPRRIYEFFPMAALLGTLLGLGALANSNELTVMRAAGMSMSRIIWSAMKMGLLFMLLVIALGEIVAPQSEQYARNMRSFAQSGQDAVQAGQGLWARDGEHFIRIRHIEPGGRVKNLSLFEFDQENRLVKLAHAQEGFYQDKEWVLEGLAQTRFTERGTEAETLTWIEWESLLNPELISVLILEPTRLSTWELYRYIGYLKDNALLSAPYELTLWQRLIYPALTLIMIFLAAPFVFGSLRTVSIGHRILVGALLGISFYLLNQTLGYVSLLYGISPLFSALLPPVMFLILGVVLMRRVF